MPNTTEEVGPDAEAVKLAKEVQRASEIILASDPRQIQTEVWIDYRYHDFRVVAYGNPPEQSDDIYRRYFDLIHRLVPDYAQRVIAAAGKDILQMSYEMEHLSDHQRLNATGLLRAILQAQGVSKDQIKGYLIR